jgi:pyruvate/2-oxoglutarate/acetoin dehydrogenase E1 component
MRSLADAGCLFVGQGVIANGIAWTPDFDAVPASQKIEFPIAEELNVGAAIGLSLTGHLVCVCIPRIDFLLRAADQIVNHLDKLEVMSDGQYKPRVIIRTQVGKRSPLDAGPQHTNNHATAFRLMLRTVRVVEVTDPEAAMSLYRSLARGLSSSVIVVERFHAPVLPIQPAAG